MNEMNDPFADSLARILAGHPGSQQAGVWPAALWNTFDEAGFPKALMPESSGGSALEWTNAFSLLALLGETAVAAPMAESMIAHWLLGMAGLEAPAGFVSIGAVHQPLEVARQPAAGPTLNGVLPRVPWGRFSDSIVTIGLESGEPRIVLIDCKASGVAIEQGLNVAGEPRDSLILNGARPQACTAAPLSAMDLMAVAAAVRSAQIAGALRAVLASSVEYANLRVQFGRKLSGFQVIQHKLAVLATQTAAALAAAQAGLEAVDALLETAAMDGFADSIDVPAAKIRAGEAAGLGASIAHQVFGAIGFTEEHTLHLHTKRLWAWRDEYGNEAFWSQRIGASIIASGPAQLWSRVTARPAAGPAAIAGGAA